MDQNTILELIETNQIDEALSSDLVQTLTILSKTSFENISQEDVQNVLQVIVTKLKEENKSHTELLVTVIRQMSKNVDYTIPVTNIIVVIEQLKSQNKQTQFTILEVINGADNLIAEATIIADKIIPILLEIIDSEVFYEDEVSLAAIELLGSLTAYSLPQSFLNALEIAEIMDNAAITAARNAPSYSSEDRAKLLQKITDNLDITSGKTHANLLMATVMLIEEDHPQLFDRFKKVSGNNKAKILRQLQDVSSFLPIHESILLYSINDTHEQVIKYADKILDAQGKNPHKKHCEEVKTWGEFRDFVQKILKDRRDIYKKSLVDYLKSVLSTLSNYKGKELRICDAARILQDSFSCAPLAYSKDWKDLPEAEENTYEELENLLKQQVVDLEQLKKSGLLNDVGEDGVEAESGNFWQNTDLFIYLELGINGHEQSNITICRWDDISNIFLMGSISE
ncbi:hypothetical protein [Candidatus Uabimicrobium sp. HlEnr_7]|uniref:hypothetical protein n=1 Tax=Candidatus Uabimicrobium helgolandensis TaxID=3095367 RepID=UPI0035579196